MLVSSGETSQRKAILIGAAALTATGVLIPVYRLQNLSWPYAIAASVSFVLPCLLFGWIVWLLLMRTRPKRSLAANVLEHTLTAVAFSTAWTFVFTTAVALIVGRELMPAFLRGGAVWQFVWGLTIYGVLVYAARATVQLKERELAAAAAELQALRAQLHPHFLFNTLHSLTQLAREDPVATQEALERFGDLMRYVLQSGRKNADDVALEEEIEFLRSYLALERLRLGERLRVVEAIDPEALELAVPPLLLQPLVENAIRHGLAPRRNGGTISLSVRTTASTLAIEVADDGCGAVPETWRHSAGLGLKAVARQLNARFPGASVLSITSRPNAGFSVQLEMPACVPTKARS